METMEIDFSKLSDDLILNIFFNLEEDPRHWARLACVCTRFSALIRNICWKTKCSQALPDAFSDLVSAFHSASPPGGWAALYKLAICCPGLHQAGVLFKNSDLAVERELSPDKTRQEDGLIQLDQSQSTPSSTGSDENLEAAAHVYFDTRCYASGSQDRPEMVAEPEKDGVGANFQFPIWKRRKICGPPSSHMTSKFSNLSREEGNKLLASRFREDCLYICGWPGCVHIEKKRKYMFFRGVLKNFKQSEVWRTINDGNRSKVDLSCAFCSSKQTWDLQSAYCLRRVFFGHHEDGEPVVRAYVCENGHVSGAWTDWPWYN